jgi:hypothetical protein
MGKAIVSYCKSCGAPIYDEVDKCYVSGSPDVAPIVLYAGKPEFSCGCWSPDATAKYIRGVVTDVLVEHGILPSPEPVDMPPDAEDID